MDIFLFIVVVLLVEVFLLLIDLYLFFVSIDIVFLLLFKIGLFLVMFIIIGYLDWGKCDNICFLVSFLFSLFIMFKGEKLFFVEDFFVVLKVLFNEFFLLLSFFEFVVIFIIWVKRLFGNVDKIFLILFLKVYVFCLEFWFC